MRALTKTLVTMAAASAMAFALGACGGSDSGGESSPGGQGGSAGAGGGAAGSSGAGGGSTQGPSCDQLCPALAACGVPADECQANCATLSGACRSCLMSSNCDPTPCQSACQGGNNGGAGGAGGGSAGGGGSSGSDLGKDCTVGGFDSQCAAGESCMSNKGGLAGICTIHCTDWSECPSFWDCQPAGGGKFCFPQ